MLSIFSVGPCLHEALSAGKGIKMWEDRHALKMDQITFSRSNFVPLWYGVFQAKWNLFCKGTMLFSPKLSLASLLQWSVVCSEKSIVGELQQAQCSSSCVDGSVSA